MIILETVFMGYLRTTRQRRLLGHHAGFAVKTSSSLRVSRSPNRKTFWGLCADRSSKDARPAHLLPVSARTLFHCQGANYSKITVGEEAKVRKKKLKLFFQERKADAPVDGVERGVHDCLPGILADQSASREKLLAFGGTQSADENQNGFAACQRQVGL